MLPLILLLGFAGTLADIVFFAVFYNTSPAMFRSLWFVLNITSNFVLIYLIRTSQFFLRASRPSWLLILSSCLSVCICFILPYSAIGHRWFAFVNPAFGDMVKVLGITLIYGVLTEFVKLQYTKYTMKMES